MKQGKKFAKPELKTCLEEFEEKLNKVHAEKKEQEVTAKMLRLIKRRWVAWKPLHHLVVLEWKVWKLTQLKVGVWTSRTCACCFLGSQVRWKHLHHEFGQIFVILVQDNIVRLDASSMLSVVVKG